LTSSSAGIPARHVTTDRLILASTRTVLAALIPNTAAAGQSQPVVARITPGAWNGESASKAEALRFYLSQAGNI